MKKSPFKYGNRNFFQFQIWRLVFLEPLGVQRRYVAHFKVLIRGNLNFEGQKRDSTFTFLHTLLKTAILLHKMAKGGY